MRTTMLWLVVLGCLASLHPVQAHDDFQTRKPIDGAVGGAVEQQHEPEFRLSESETHPEIAALVRHANGCVEFRVKSTKRERGSEAKRIERCD